MAFIGILSLKAQTLDNSQLTPLAVNPKVKSGVLPNGLSYYILHNEEPKERANFYIAQKVGSSLEEQDQLGLAHFLEHLAFNGTSHFPGKNMLNYLQSKGIRFGADINAYTSFDETVYNINNVPTTDTNLMDSVLLVLHDWSGEILLEDGEIEAERGVIQEEWRSGNNANRRMYTTILPKIYEEYQYQQMPIGKMEVVMNFKPEVLRAYYKKWYRPDLQGIVIVGDFDADEMENKVKTLFSSITMPENAAPRTYPEVSNNKEPIFVSYSDPELTNLMTTISFKSEKVPFELRNTEEMYVQTTILESILSQLLNNRLNDFSLDPECQYINAGVYFGDFYVSKTKDSFNIRVLSKNNSQKGVQDALRVIAQACKTGFNESEYERVCQELMAPLEKALAEKDKMSNAYLARQLYRHFIDNTPAPAIEKEFDLWSSILPSIQVPFLNYIASQLLTEENMVVVTSAPTGDGYELAEETAMLSNIKEVINAEYQALEDEMIKEPLISELPESGKIVSQTENEQLGIRLLTLSNGAKVVLKPTDFAGDEILLTAYREGGKRVYEKEQAPNVLMMPFAFQSSKIGPFDLKQLRKYLAGKNVDIDFKVNNYTDVLTGVSTVKDLPSLFELIYTAFTNLNPDESNYNVNIERSIPGLMNRDKNPRNIFFGQIEKTRFEDNPLMWQQTVETLEDANYLETLDLIKGVLSNAGQYTFIFTGNIDDETITPLIEQYLASLPSKGMAIAPAVKTKIQTTKGQIVNEFKQPMETPATMVYDYMSGSNLEYTVENVIMTNLAGDILDNIFTDTLREEEGGTYSPQANASYNPNTKEWSVLYLFITNADQQAKLIKRANDEWMHLLENGADEVNFNKAKEAMIKQYEIDCKKNAYWDSALITQLRFPQVQVIDGYYEALQNVNLEKFNQFLKNLYDGKNRIQVIMEGISNE